MARSMTIFMAAILSPAPYFRLALGHTVRHNAPKNCDNDDWSFGFFAALQFAQPAPRAGVTRQFNGREKCLRARCQSAWLVALGWDPTKV
jgi:hypothetical protein